MSLYRKIILVDIDGTVSKIGDRLKYLQSVPKDWDAFYEACDEDEPIVNIIEMIKVLKSNYRIVFCTGRRESVRAKTVSWIHRHVRVLLKEYTDNLLLMRKDGDYRHDTLVKPELVLEAGISLEDIAFVLEDRSTMVSRWRELGLTCLQVAEGSF